MRPLTYPEERAGKSPAVVVRLAVLLALLANSLSGCGSLTTTCADFNTASDAKMQELAEGWLKNNADEVQAIPLFSMKSHLEQVQYVMESLLQYCDDNPDNDLSELTPGYAFGS
mgnify:FL=1